MTPLSPGTAVSPFFRHDETTFGVAPRLRRQRWCYLLASSADFAALSRFTNSVRSAGESTS